MVIRDACLADLEQLSTLAKRAKAHWGYPQAWLASWDSELTIQPTFLQHAIVRVAVTASDQPSAFFAASQTNGVWELSHAWVDPAAIGQGLGRMLFQDMLVQLRAKAVATFEILSDPNAAPFYEKMGAQKMEDRPSNQMGRSLPLYRYQL